MKKYLFVFYLLMVFAGMFLFVSCGGDDEYINDQTNNQEICKVNNNGHAYVDFNSPLNFRREFKLPLTLSWEKATDHDT